MAHRSTASLAVDRMTDEQLWRRLERRLAELERDVEMGLNQKSRLPLVREVVQIVRELRMRGTQLSLDVDTRTGAVTLAGAEPADPPYGATSK